MSNDWIGVDPDGTLAVFDGWKNPEHIGEPIAPMVDRVKAWIAEGVMVKIFTARVDGGTAAMDMGVKEGEDFQDIEAVKKPIEEWCLKHLGVVLEITNKKDFAMMEIWDDRCVPVITNTGIIGVNHRR